MTFELTGVEEEFRESVRSFLEAELTPELREAGRRCSGIFADYPDAIRWHRVLARRGWSVPHWPVEHGGTGWTPLQQYIFASELAASDAPTRSPNGTHMVAPVIIAFGSEEQKARWLPGILNGDDYWAQGYSEPNAGSDLASLQCRAELEPDGMHYVLNGTKIWTTHLQWANRIFCLVRTSNAGKRQHGISFLCFDLDLPGITVRPIISISGDHELNQVFFDDVRVPVSALIGKQDEGWTIAKYLLEHERGAMWAPLVRARLPRLRNAVCEALGDLPSGRFEPADQFRKLAELEADIDALEAFEIRALRGQTRGKPSAIQSSIGKVIGTETRQRMTELGMELAGSYGSADVRIGAASSGELPIPEEAVFNMNAYLNDRAASIYGGSNEVQRNIIAAHLLADSRDSGKASPDETEMHAMLRDSLARYLEQQYGFNDRLRAIAGAIDTPPPLWRGLSSDLGILGASFPEAWGGLGGGVAENQLIMELLGGALAGEPYLSTVVVGGGLLRRVGGSMADRLIPRIIDGQTVFAFAHVEPHAHFDSADVRTSLSRDGGILRLHGRKAVVRNAPWATHLVVTARAGNPDDGLSVLIVERNSPGVVMREYPERDGGRAAEIRFDGVPVSRDMLIGEEGRASLLLEEVIDEATLAVCAEAIGVMRRLMNDTIEYVRERKQFGVPISSFQVLQHRLADMFMALEKADALVKGVASCLDTLGNQRARAVSSAKVATCKACRTIGQGAVQLHGAMGMTEELAVGHYFRRATAIESLFGSLDYHLRRYERLTHELA